ncbi:MAG: Stp1/IreP family PP2C-type Ser/Thr phosphatase [Chloroflexales bacterium]|nr:Stp1/IreP family PP2C-type Ser/Thr phosphatase [Chloroflexales bacterium]
MTDQGTRACTSCGAPLTPAARFCTRCGTPVGDEPEEVALAGGRRLHLSSSDTLSLRELLAVVESGVFYWRQRLESAEGVARENAASAIKDLSQILDNLATQIAQGRETVRVTGRLLPQRLAPHACPICGRGNRDGAKYCVACGSPMRPGVRPATHLPPPLSLSVATRTDVGMARKLNEDMVYAGEFTTADGGIGTLLVVADGMGGHQAGEVAASLACDTLKAYLTAALSAGVPAADAGWHDLLRAAVSEANSAVYTQSQRNPAQRGMGTTMTVAVITGRRAHLAHVGDSRAYLINPAGVTGESVTWLQLTTDHSLVARLVDIGQLTPEEARVHPQRNVVYRSLGGDPTLEVDTASQALARGDLLLLCSDGLVNHVDDVELARIVIDEPSAARACERLTALANERGGKDNISIVIARVK